MFDVPGYDPAKALLSSCRTSRPTMLLADTLIGFRTEIAARQGFATRNIDWSAVSPGTAWRLAEEQFEAAQVPLGIRATYFDQLNAYLDSVLGR
jgi:hypothetical protein